MRWQGRRQSSQVEDRRGAPRGRGVAVGGCGTILLVLVISWLTGTNPSQLLQLLDQNQASVGTGPSMPASSAPGGRSDDQLAEFASVVLADTEQTWQEQFRRMGRHYELPSLVLFDDSVHSACGLDSAASGPFYCPGDSKLYLDLSFFDELGRRFGAPGDFAQAYVIAHEIGHHVQNQLGISDQVRQLQQRMSREEGNALSVKLELQADCLAGVWGHHAHTERQLLEPGDVEEGLGAAQAIGDDQLQQQAGGRVRPESWTHGSSKQRARWLRRGLETGDPDSCDTFESRQL